MRLVPALKGRAKFMPTLRVEDTYSELPKDWTFDRSQRKNDIVTNPRFDC
jgi:hypothetical protein